MSSRLIVNCRPCPTHQQAPTSLLSCGSGAHSRTMSYRVGASSSTRTGLRTMTFSNPRNSTLFTHTTREATSWQRYYRSLAPSSSPRPIRSSIHTPPHSLTNHSWFLSGTGVHSIPFSSSSTSLSLSSLSSSSSTTLSSLSHSLAPSSLSSRGLSGSASKSASVLTRSPNTTKRFSSTASVESQGCTTPPTLPRSISSQSAGSNHAWYIPPTLPRGGIPRVSQSSLHAQQSLTLSQRLSLLQNSDPLPLPLALKLFSPTTGTSSTTATAAQASLSRMQLNNAFQPPAAVLGSQPMFYLARRFPILAEQELKAIPNKTALDYSSFLIGAMSTSYPSPTTLRAVMRQFKNFLKDSTRRGSAMELPRARIWTQVIRGLIWMKEYRRARALIHMTQRMGIRPTGYAWRAICRGWIEQGQLEHAEALAAKVFTNPSLSHDYHFEERPYYFTDMPSGASALDLSPPGTSPRPARPPPAHLGESRPASGSRSGPFGSPLSSPSSSTRLTRRSPMAPNSAPLFLVIEALAEQGEMERARYWFDQVPESELTDLLTSDMVHGYLRVGQKSKAQEVIRIMARAGIKPTAIVFNPIVEHAVQKLGMETAEGMVKDMVQLRIYLNLFTYKLLVKGYLASGQQDKALECIDRMRVSGIEPDRALGRMILDGFLKDDDIHNASLGFEETKFALTKKGDDGPPLIMNMDRIQTEQATKVSQPTDLLSQPGWSQQCLEWIKGRDLEPVEEMLQLALDQAVDVSQGSRASSPKLGTEVVQVIRGLAQEGLMDRARYWFEHLAKAESRKANNINDNSTKGMSTTTETMVELVNELVAGYVRCFKPDEAQGMIALASEQGIQPTVETIHSILDWSTGGQDMEEAEQMVSRMDQAGIQPDRRTYEILCLGYAARGEIDGLKQSLARMEKATGFGGESVDPALFEICQEMLGNENPLNSTTTSTATTGVFERLCARWVGREQMDQAEQLIERLIENENVGRSKIPYKTMIRGWIESSQRNSPISSTALDAIITEPLESSKGKSMTGDHKSDLASESVPSSKSLRQEMAQRKESVSRMKRARAWFDRVPREGMTPDLVNEMMHGYLTLGLESESEQLIGWMAAEKIKPNVETYNHIMRHTVLKVSMTAAEALLQKMESRGSGGGGGERLGPNVETWNLLIRGYVMRGELSKALACLDRMMGRAEEQPPSKRMMARASQSKSTTVEAEEIRGKSEKVEKEPTAATVRPFRGKNTTTARTIVKPNEQTIEILLAGFGAETRMPQGEGDYERALDLYRNRVERQEHQRTRLFEGLRAVNGGKDNGEDRGAKDVEEELDTDQLLKRWEVWQQQQQARGGERGLMTDLWMTDLDWRAELQWEETLEIERSRERELSGKSLVD